MIGKAPGDPNDLLRTAKDGANHTHVGDAPAQVRMPVSDEAEIIRLFNAIVAGADAVIIVKRGQSLRFMFSKCGVWGAISMMRDVIAAKENG